MKKTGLALFVLTMLCNIIFASPVLTKSKYLISVLSEDGNGAVTPGIVNYPLIYNTDLNNETATDADYWIIKKQADNTYTFQNFASKKYIKHDIYASNDRSALVLVDAIQTDKSTSFTLELKATSGMSYYIIRSVNNTQKIWNKRTSLSETNYPVGVYSGSGATNELFIFSGADGVPVTDDSFVVKPPFGRQTLGAFTNYADSLKFDLKTPVVDTSKKEFFLTIPESKMGTSFAMNVVFKPRSSSYKLYLGNQLVTSGTAFTFTNVTSLSSFAIEIRDGATVLATGILKFSCLPLVQIYCENTIGWVYNASKLTVTEPDKTDTTELLQMNIKLRGATAGGKPKKSYALKLKDADGVSSLDRSFLGLRNDNNWILDAMFIDPARMRNRVSTDLWNEFATLPYYSVSEPKLRNGTRGGFVEVFLNDAYNGLYCMTEKIDRKQLNLKKLKYNIDSTVVTQRGGMYKASDWTFSTLLGKTYWDGRNHSIVSYSNYSDLWNGYENKYPDLGDGEPIEWKPLYDAVNVSSDLNSDANFKANVDATFDLPVFLDYYLFIELMLATDNQGKNTYLSVYDQTVSPKLTITPWDCDGVWGRRWDGSSNLTYANQNFETFLPAYEHSQNNLYLRLLRLNYNGFNTNLRNRYQQLRGSYFSYSSLYNRFSKYSNLFTKSGAASRESSRWSIGSITSEMNFLSNWITQRLSYLDNQYLGGPYVDTRVNSSTRIRFNISPNPVRDMLTVSGLQSGDRLQLISMQGTILLQKTVDNDNYVIDMSNYSTGIYLIKVNNEMTKVIKK